MTAGVSAPASYLGDDLVTGEAVAVEMPVASLPARIGAALIDLVVLYVLATGSTVGLAFVIGSSSAAVGTTLTLLFVVFWFVVWPAGWEAITRGRTLGKLALGLRTVRDDGGPIVTRHAVTRALVGWVELWLTFGMVAIVAALLNRRGKRLGDLAAGTYVIHDRVSLRMAQPVPMPPELAAWARDADVAELPPGLAVALRQFLGRAAGMSPAAREVLGSDLIDRVLPYVSPNPPAGTPREAVLAAVLAERRTRDAGRLRRETALRERVVPADPVA